MDGEDEIIESVPLQERVTAAAPQPISPAEKREYQDAVALCVTAAREADDDEAYDKAVRNLCEIAVKLDYRPMWAYWQLTKERHLVNTRALHSIARIKNYHPWWARKEAERIRAQLEEAGA